MGYFSGLVIMSGGRWWLTLIFIYFFTCSSFFCSQIGASSSNETDRLALLAFKAKIHDDRFGIMNLWNDSTHFCQWYGVTCSKRRPRVTQLNLLGLKLGGSISPHIGNLSFLHTLRLYDNNFIREIPPEIGHLRRLQVLNLLNNTLSGEIPVNLSGCLELRALTLSNNKLEGQIPFELGSLSKLQYLGVSKNSLVGALPPSLGNLTFLENCFVSLNYLVGRIPETLGDLGHLTQLALGGNQFFGDVPDSIFNLSSIEILDVGSNHLGRHLPPDLFNKLPNLNYLSFQDNQFTGPIPVSLSNATNMQSLQLSVNKFTGKVPVLENLKMLSVFLVFENQLGLGYGAKDDLSFLCSLTNATSLRLLSMDTNNFGGMLPSCITNLSSQLTHFMVYNNYISGTIPPSIDNLKGLESLMITNNSFTGKIPHTIGNLKNLVTLYLSQNNLSRQIPTSLGNLSRLVNLNLSYNSLEGNIPSSLEKCSFLQILSLDHNNLTGFIPPKLLTLPSLSVTLSISQNQLIGPLPEEVGKLTNLYQLDMSANMLSGNIPDSLGGCTSLQFLALGGNNFQGPIPSSLSSMKGLQMLDLSSNNLSGQIPNFLASLQPLIFLNLSFNDLEGDVPKKGVFLNASDTSLKGNSKLCGGMPDFHLPDCISFPERKQRKLSAKMKVIIAITVGLAGIALLILLLLVYIFGLRKKRRQNPEELVVAPLQFVSYGDLHRAANGFSQENLIGIGNFGHVYRGILGEEGNVVAIKVLNLKNLGASRSFIAECQALRNIRHKNLVKLLTVCSGTDYRGNAFKALVYEFMTNGSLEDWLHNPPITIEDEVMNLQMPPRKLGLFQRLSIAIDVASLLEYVHHEFGTPLVHCDIKPSNILLDGDLSAHVNDFGLAKFLSDVDTIHSPAHVSSSIGVRGTVGYAPPEYGLGSEVSTQGDVYSYGILLLEMFTGKRPTHEMFNEGLSLHLFAKLALSSGVADILDPTLQDFLEAEDSQLNLSRSVKVMECLALVIEIGVACSLDSPMERMDMNMVTTKLCRMRDNLIGRRS